MFCSPRQSGFFILAIAPFFAHATAHAATSVTHPNFQNLDWNVSATPPVIVPYQSPGGVASSVSLIPENGALTLRNRAGGSFSVKINCTPFDAEKLTHLVFDYKVGTDTKIDFFFRINGIYHGALFTGPGQVRPGSVTLGKIEGVKTDEQWHQAVIPIRAWLRRLYPTAETLKVDELVAGNWNNQNYLLAGINGNGPGATWHLNNLALVGDGPMQAKIRTESPTIVLNGGAPQRIPAGQEKTLELKPGLNWLVEQSEAGASRGRMPLWASAAPAAEPPYWRSNDLVWPISDGAGLDTRSLNLEVNSAPVPLDGTTAYYDGMKEELVFRAALKGLSWKNKTAVPVRLSGVLDKLGRGPGSLEAKAILEYASHKAPVPTPVVQVVGVPDMGDGSFENSLDEWAPGPATPGAIVERDAARAVHGRHSLRLTCSRSATRFEATIRSTAFDAAKFPVITFNYLATDRLRVDFKIIWAGQPYSIGFTDRDNDVPRLGILPGILSDGQWHSASIPLLEWMKKLRPNATSYMVDRMTVGDEKWLGNARGVQWWVDNWRFVPDVTGGQVNARVTLADVTGVQATSWVLDDKPETDPGKEARGQAAIVARGSGNQWLHVRAQNGAGQWSDATHTPVSIRGAAPLPAGGTAF